MAAGPVVVSVIGDVRDLQEKLKFATSSVENFGAGLKTAGRKLTLGLTLPLVGLGTAAVVAFSDAQKAATQTEAVLKSTGGAAGVTAKHVETLSNKLAALSGVDDDVIRSSQNVLLTFTAIKAEGGIFDAATKAALDMSVALGTDLQGATIQVGKALQDPIKGVSALQRVGVSFTEAQKEQIKAMVEAGDVAGAQAFILKELQVEFGGSAQAAGTTLAGQLGILRTQFENVTGQLVANMLPAVTSLIEKVLGAVQWFGNLSAGTQQMIVVVALAAAALGPLLTVIGNVIIVVKALQAAMLFLAANPIVLVIAGIGLLVAALVLLFQKNETFRNAVLTAWNGIKTVILGVWGVIRPVLNALKETLELIVGSAGKVIGLVGKIPGAGLLGKAGSLLPFQGGGVVPGMRGQAVPILAHAGERITPAGAAAGNITINVSSQASAAGIADELSWAMRTMGV